jgi:CheY-like chemotaxis protein
MAASSEQRRVLVVDDDPGIRALLADVLEAEGFEVRGAANGRVGLVLAAEGPPDVILLDYGMPVCSGPEFAATYRQRPPPHAPIVLITAAGEAARRAEEVHADDYLGKPFELARLIHLVQRYAA